MAEQSVQSVVVTTRDPENEEKEEDRKVAFIFCCNCCLFIIMVILLLLLMIRFMGNELEMSESTSSPKYRFSPSSGGGNGKKTAGNTTTSIDKSLTGQTTPNGPGSSLPVATSSSLPSIATGQSSESETMPTATGQGGASSLLPTSDSGDLTSDMMTSAPSLDSSSVSQTTTTTRLPSTLICVFEYLPTALWPKEYACSDYVFIRFFTYSSNTTSTLEFGAKQQLLNGVVRLYYDETPELWNQYPVRTLDGRVRRAMRTFANSSWNLGIWGATYIRLMVSLWHPNTVRETLHRTLRSDFSPLIKWSNFSGFAIINSIIQDAKPLGQAVRYSNIFRGNPGSNPGILEPNWTLIHTAAIWPGGNAMLNETLIALILREADVVGISTSNSTDEPNIINTLSPLLTAYRAASPPNPINPVVPNTRGMLDILAGFPHWKQVLNRSRLCFSVTTAINYARNSVTKIDFINPIREKQDVQRYSRYQFTTANSAAQYPVQQKNMTYSFDNQTYSHFWRFVDDRGTFVRFFAYDDGNTLGYKVKKMLEAYPSDRCVVFDDLGEDGTARQMMVSGTNYEFKAYDMLKAVVNALNETSLPTSATSSP